MKQILVLLLFTFTISLTSCTGKQQKNSNNFNGDPKSTLSKNKNMIPVIDLHKEYPRKEIVLQDIAEVEYIPIETNDSSLLTAGSFSRMTWNHYLIVSYQSTIFFFDNKGLFHHSINRRGGSGEEYSDYITALNVDFNTKEVFVYDYRDMGSRIQVYSFEGEFKRSLKTPDKTNFITSLFDLDTEYLFAEDHYNVDREGIEVLNHSPYYKISKKDGHLTQLPITIEKRIRDGLSFKRGDQFTSISIGASPVMKNGSEMIISDFALDTVYSFKEDVLTPIAVRKNRISKKGNPILAALQMKTDRYLLWTVIEKDIDVKTMSMSEPKALLFDRYTGECNEVNFVNEDGIESVNKARRLSHYLGRQITDLPPNYAICPFAAEDLVSLYNEGKLKGRLKEIASTLKEDDNAVLMLLKFKE